MVCHTNLNKLWIIAATNHMSTNHMNPPLITSQVSDGQNCFKFFVVYIAHKISFFPSCPVNIISQNIFHLRVPSTTFCIILMSIYMSQLSLFLVSPTNTTLCLLISTATQLSEETNSVFFSVFHYYKIRPFWDLALF